MEENTVINSLHGEFARTITHKFSKAVEEFQLIKSGDKICVCVSGGKDSMLLAALFRDYERHGKIPVSVRYLAMDPGYSEENFSMITENAKRLGLPLETFRTEIFRHTEFAENPCFLCSKMRRGHLYSKARELGCNKIALGHHFDDVIESTLMGMLYGGQTQTMLPKLRARNYAGMELIRPLFYVRERDIIDWRDYNGLRFLRCACRITSREDGSKRKLVKRLISELAEDNPQVEQNIFRSVCTVRLDRLISYKDKDGVHTFLDNYDDELY